jgi:predicted membrane protein
VNDNKPTREAAMRHTTEETRRQTADDDDVRIYCRTIHPGRSIGTAIFGLGILLFGVLLTLDNLDIIEIGDYWRFWPVLLIGVGLSHLAGRGECRKIGWGLFWIFAGGIFLLDNLGYISWNVWDLWPVALVFVGANVLWGSLRTRRRKQPSNNASEFEATAILGGVSRRVTSRDFRGGQATAVLGGCELDLREAAISSGPAEIEVFAFWGGIEMRVPQEWDVQVKASAILGGIEDKTSTIGDGSQVLVISGTALMGGVEIRN